MLTIRLIIKSSCFLTMYFYRLWSFSGKNFEKKLFFQIFRKVTYNLILIWRIQYSNSFFQIFSSLFLFFPRLVKNVLKMGQKFFIGFSWKLTHYLILIRRIQKLKSFFQAFLSSFLFLPQLVKNVLKNGLKIFFSDFHENCHIT